MNLFRDFKDLGESHPTGQVPYTYIERYTRAVAVFLICLSVAIATLTVVGGLLVTAALYPIHFMSCVVAIFSIVFIVFVAESLR